ncbi:MAG: helix-turn-helix domain-containing protein [Actinomycetota bacterium]
MDDARRSDCPISYALDIVGDRWSVLVIRDIALYGKTGFTDFLGSDEGIAESVLARRLRDLERNGLIGSSRPDADGRRKHYHLTRVGQDLLPVLVALARWGADHDPESTADPAVFERAAALIRSLGD